MNEQVPDTTLLPITPTMLQEDTREVQLVANTITVGEHRNASIERAGNRASRTLHNAQPSYNKRTSQTANIPSVHSVHKKQKVVKARGFSFTKGEVGCLLDILEYVLPIGPVEWETVSANHKDVFPNCQRTTDSLRRKFASLYRTKVPTGDQHCPEEVSRAKRINELIKDKADIGNADEDLGVQFKDNEEEEGVTDIEGGLHNNNDEDIGHRYGTQNAEHVIDVDGVGVLSNRRLTHSRRRKPDENHDLVTLYKMSILEEQKDRKEQRKREEQRIDREREREQREALRFERLQENMMSMMMLLVGTRSSHRDEHNASNQDGDK